MKGCELCSGAARMYCESDQARLCWDCDARVHGANFLVARHTRRLLCRACQSPTPWRAAGPRLAPTLSLCHRCCNKSTAAAAAGQQEEEDVDDEGQEAAQVRDGDAMDHDEEDDDEDDEDEEEEEEEDEEEDGDNQVVPWSSTTTATPPPPPIASSSSSEESTSRIGNGFLKRMRENADPFSEHDLAASSSSSHPIYFVSRTGPSLSAVRTAAAAAAEDEATSFRSASARAAAGGAAAKKPQRNSQSSVAVRNDRRDVRTVDLVSSSSRSPPI